MGRKPKRPWGDLGKPIERLFRRDDERHGEFAQNAAFAEQYGKMCELKASYEIEGETGWRPWYELALALALERDDGLKIIDPPKGKKAARWRGAEGLQLIGHVEYLKKEQGEGATIESAIAELQQLKPAYGVDKISPDHLRKNYQDAKRHHGCAVRRFEESTKHGAK